MAQLRPGAFLGDTVSVRSAGAIFSHVSHAQARIIPEHTHEWPYVSILLRGTYEETVGRQKITFDALTMVFHGPTLSHHDVIGPGGAEFFLIEFGEPWWPVIENSGVFPRHAYELHAEAATWSTLRLYGDFISQALTEESAEEGLFHLCSHLPRGLPIAHREPPWLRTVDEFTSANFRQRYSLRELARYVCVDPAHLARTYYRFRGRTIGDAVNRLRAQEACRRLNGSKLPLEVIAQDCGFADQSHMTRALRALSGSTPAALRRALP